jgi:hypothetical protein
MSINNLEFTSYNFLSNLSSVNADEVNTNILTKSDPDISDLQFDMLEGINTNETIQQQIDNVTVDVTGLIADVLTLQGEMTTVQGQISTLDGEVNTAQDDINDLQSDVSALYGITSSTAAAVAGLSVSQAAQDVIIATHTTQIANLQGDVNDAEDDINALQTKTQHQSATGFRTIFATTVEVGGVSINTNSASTFDDGLSASAAITSSAGTSQFSSLLVNTAAEVTNDLTITDGEIYIRRNTLTASKKLILYDNTTGNDYDYLGFWTDSGAAGKKFLNAEIDGVAGSAFQWYAGDGAGTSRTLLKQVTSANEIGYTPLATFLKTTGFSQQIQMVKDAPNNIVRIDMLGDTAGLNAFDGQIIQAEGNGVDDNRGTMTIQSGGLAINALNTGLNIQATTSTLIQSGTTTTLTSDGETEINCNSLDINIVGLTTIDTQGITITGTGAGLEPDLILTNPTSGVFQIASATDQDLLFGINGAADFYVQSDRSVFIEGTAGDINLTATDIKLTSTGTGAGELVVRANTNIDLKTLTGRIDIDSDQALNLIARTATTLTSATTTTLTSTGETEINSAALDINATGAVTVDTTDNMTFTKTGATGGISFNSGNFVLIDATDEFLFSGGGHCEFVSGADFLIQTATTTQIDSNILDINTSAEATINAVGYIDIASDVDVLISSGTTTTITATTDINLNGTDINLTTTGTNFGKINITASTDVTINPATTFLAEVNGVDKLTITSTATTLDVNNSFNMMPTATIIQNMSATVPAGFLYCDGQSVLRAGQYARLFAAIGTTFGSVSGTTFNVPNLKGAYLRGTSNQTVGGVVYTGPAIGTAQQDSVLAPNNRGFYNIDSGGGGSSRQVRSRANIGGDPNDTSTAQTTNFARENTTENRVFNYSVYYYIRY